MIFAISNKTQNLFHDIEEEENKNFEINEYKKFFKFQITKNTKALKKYQKIFSNIDMKLMNAINDNSLCSDKDDLINKLNNDKTNIMQIIVTLEQNINILKNLLEIYLEYKK